MPRKGPQQEFMLQQGWVLASEAAKLLRINPTSIYVMLDRKDSPFRERRIGSLRYVSVDSIRSYLGDLAEEFLGAAKV